MIECSICKANNEDRSLYCLECGQRLNKTAGPASPAEVLPSTSSPSIQHPPQMSSPNSARLHSPILDLGGQMGARRGKNSFSIDEEMPEPNRSKNISRNGLYSPLLDGRNHLVSPHPSNIDDDEQAANIPANPSALGHTEKSRLHSPVLDGISSAINGIYIEESFTQQEEYESLRSPLLKAKVPLPDKNQIQENAAGQESPLQSVLGSATGPSAKVSPNIEKLGGQNPFVAPLSITGINTLSKGNARKFAKTGSSVTSNSIPLLSREEALSREEVASADLSVGSSKIGSSKGERPLNKMFLSSIIFLALGFKIWYLVSLGSAAFGSAPFAFDQGGQIMILVLLLILVLS